MQFYKKISLYLLLAACYFLSGGCITSEYNIGTHRQDIIFYSSEKEVSLGHNIAKQIAKSAAGSVNLRPPATLIKTSD